MLRNLLAVVTIGLVVYALFDVLRSTGDERFGVPRVVWLLVVLVFPLVGAVVWLAVSRGARGGWGGGRPGSRPVAPDDDPEFLRSLDVERRRHGGPADGEPPAR